MGFDVTFHPTSLDDLQRYCFDVVDCPGLSLTRAAEAVDAEEARQDLLGAIYDNLPGLLASTQTTETGFGSSVAFAAAAVAGYRHPYWYARGSAIAFLLTSDPDLTAYFRPLTTVAKGVVATLTDDSMGFLSANYSASGYVPADEVPRLAEALIRVRKRENKVRKQARVFDDDGWEAVTLALGYAERHGLGFLEATDLVVPINDECYTYFPNLRAHFLGNHRQQQD